MKQEKNNTHLKAIKRFGHIRSKYGRHRIYNKTTT